MTMMTHPHADTLTARFYRATRVIHWRNWTVMVLLGIGAVFMLLPFMWTFSTSLRPISEAYRLPPSFLPDRLDFSSYARLEDGPIPFLTMYWNSFVVAAVTTVVVIFTSAMAAFAFSRLRFPGSNVLFASMLVGLMVPPALVLIPLFFGMAAVGLIDTLWSLILPALANPLAVLMMREFMRSQPREYEESAFVDGASYWTIFWRISLPQMGPPIAALSIIVFTTSWNNFLLPLVFVRSFEAMTLPVGILSLFGSYGAEELSVILAAVTLSILPLLVVFLIAQRFIVESIASTGVKK
ncbi:sugar ABC transporter permease [Oceanicola granulosus HTCC2516]|uniref:Sugar ABC transporter permease n=1 Tax=Oceanicola granulosus (strain ATCC BAA-861 / DSM 15982 / KCTC 12143 / HTCC2516) TaxID=314256 RepID=Q2CGN2_OCEGH|nr:carbohydrate ABC transporter permease [Oceanicola granulosus]EAR51903.1 sugar ABC transporter permease [Oceanicola granulosus HTCC2516]